MTSFLLRIEAIEAKVLSNCCPRGTSGRLHSLRLKRRFQHPARWQSSAASPVAVSEQGERISRSDASNADIKDAEPDTIDDARPEDSSESRLKASLSSKKERLKDKSSAPHSQYVRQEPPRFHASQKMRRSNLGQYFHQYPEMKEDTEYIQRSPNGDIEITWGNAARDGKEVNQAGAEVEAEPELTVKRLHEILRAKDPHAALQFAARLSSIAHDTIDPVREFAELPASTFTEFLSSLDADFLFGEYLQFEKQIPKNSPHYTSLFDPHETNARHFFIRTVTGLVKLRLKAGQPLSLSDCQHVLGCARFAGSKTLSGEIWKYMSVAGVSPDTICYNHYLATKVRSDLLIPAQRHKVRVTPRNLMIRTWMRPIHAFSGYKVGDKGVKYEATQVLDEMSRRGVAANEETMCLVMIGFAKEGDLNGVKNILDKTWGINVDKFLALGEEGIGHDFQAGSPIKPSPLLLETLAHMFGINNSIPLALRLLDFVSRRYSIVIPYTAWEELLERTFVLSMRKSEKRNKGFSEGSLPITAVSNLWDTFTGDPYKVKPNMAMYDKMIRILLHQQRFGQAQVFMKEALVRHRNRAALYHSLIVQRQRLPTSTPWQKLRDMDNKIWITSLQVHRNRQYLRTWVRQLIHTRTIKMRGLSGEEMDAIMERWKAYLPRRVEYRIPTATVRIRTDSEALNRKQAKASRAGSRTPHNQEDFDSGKDYISDDQTEDQNLEGPLHGESVRGTS